MKSAAALGRPWQLRSQCRFICLADSSTPASLHALLYPAISGFICSARRQILLFVVESAPANPLAFKRVLQPGAWGCLHPQLQESSYKGCSVKRVETGSAYAFSALGALVSVFFLCWRLYSHLCLIASDGFIFQEFVRLLSGFIAVSICSSQWQCVTKEGVFSAEVLLLLCNFLLIKPFWALGFLFCGKSWWFFYLIHISQTIHPAMACHFASSSEPPCSACISPGAFVCQQQGIRREMTLVVCLQETLGELWPTWDSSKSPGQLGCRIPSDLSRMATQRPPGHTWKISL